MLIGQRCRYEDANPPRVDLVDDDDGFRASLIRLLAWSGIDAVGYRCAGEYLLAADQHEANCVMLDMRMSGPSGLELLDALVRRPASPPVILLTAYSDIPISVHAIKAGAVSFLEKPIDRKRLLASLEKALALDAEHRTARREIQVLEARYAELTRYEREIFDGVVDGKLNKQLAAALGICERTVKSYRSRVMRKMQAPSLVDLVRMAKLLGMASHAFAEHGQIAPDEARCTSSQ